MLLITTLMQLCVAEYGVTKSYTKKAVLYTEMFDNQAQFCRDKKQAISKAYLFGSLQQTLKLKCEKYFRRRF